jgi:hypothetical protein
MSSLTGESRFFSSAQGHTKLISASCASLTICPGLKAVVAGDNCQQFDLRVVPAMTATAPPLFGPDMLADPYASMRRSEADQLE